MDELETVEAFIQAAYDGGFKKALTPSVAAAMSNIIDEARRQDAALAEAREALDWQKQEMAVYEHDLVAALRASLIASTFAACACEQFPAALPI